MNTSINNDNNVDNRKNVLNKRAKANLQKNSYKRTSCLSSTPKTFPLQIPPGKIVT